jgi:hypothetical protein
MRDLNWHSTQRNLCFCWSRSIDVNKDTAPDYVHSLSSFSQYLLDPVILRTPLSKFRVNIQLSGDKVADIPVNLNNSSVDCLIESHQPISPMVEKESTTMGFDISVSVP